MCIRVSWLVLIGFMLPLSLANAQGTQPTGGLVQQNSDASKEVLVQPISSTAAGQNGAVCQSCLADLVWGVSQPNHETAADHTSRPAYPNPATPPTRPQDVSASDRTEAEAKEEKPQVDLYGFAMMDLGYNFGQIDPNWFDTVRPTKLPAFHNEFGHNGVLFAGVRQSRFGVKAAVPTKYGTFKTVFEFELFGVGVDAGQTTFRLRHAYGELGQFLAGQTWSPFMDPDVFPNSIEYWGPNGMVFFRNVQFRWQPVHHGNHQVMIALERPGASADLGSIQDRDIIKGVRSRFPAPDLSGRVRYGNERTYLQVAGMFRYIAWDDTAPTTITNLSGHTYGWGTHISSNVGVSKKDTLKMSVVYGHGVENYMNDAPVDVAPRLTTNIHKPIAGDSLPVLGLVTFYDRYWSEKWSTSVGWSMVNINNVPLQLPSTFRRGHYGLVNLLYYPVKNVMMGGEFQWGRRDNFTDGWIYDDYRVQFSFRYNFDITLGGGK